MTVRKELRLLAGAFEISQLRVRVGRWILVNA